ncbi:AmmeMemoRadiSam system protein B [candidate division KSB1 bacterium]|nr:AmmeMemoRadiSam system protein B [candidate division KSB1 bacterium]
MKTEEIRKSAVAGTWYTDDPDLLHKEISRYLENSKLANIEGEIFALIAPHAGYQYSGFVAANAYKQVMGNRYDAVIVLAPSHREMFYGVSVFNKDGYETPLGIVPVEKNIANAIIEQNEKIRSSWEGHRQEHSLEIQLPFLQVAIPDLKIVPIVFWDHSWENCKLLADAITKAIAGKNVLLVASSDLYHGESYDECKETDARTMDLVTALQPEALCTAFQNREIMACGAGGIVVAEMIAMNLGANQAKVVYRTNSGDVTRKQEGYIVGYAAVAIYKEKESQKEKPAGIDSGLKERDKKTLLTTARKTIEHALTGKKIPKPASKSAILKEKRGAFVTLTKKGALRGCIGYIQGIKPLEETIIEMAQAAAFRDPRFQPVTLDELDDLEIEISVLTPIQEISDVDEIVVGKHGLIIERGGYSGLLLPQVATDYGWDRDTFLEHTCQKAGLAPDAWKKSGTIIKVFSADVFHEQK